MKTISQPGIMRGKGTVAPCPPRPGIDLLVPAEAAYLLNRSVATLARWRVAGTGPAFTRPMRRMVFYRRADIEAFLGEAVQSTTEADARDCEAAS